MYYLFRFVLPLVAIMFATVSIARQGWLVGPFSATRVEFDTVQPKKVKRLSKIQMSQKGVREEEQDLKKSGEARFAMVMNFDDGKAWYLVPRRKIYIEMPSAEAPGVKTTDEPGAVLSPAPCEGYTIAEKQKVTKHDGRNVEEWLCHSESTGDVQQLFDPVLRVVVRNEDAKGHVTELRNIQEGAQPESLFTIPVGYRKASMQEIMTGKTELPSYPEDQPGKKPNK